MLFGCFKNKYNLCVLLVSYKKVTFLTTLLRSEFQATIFQNINHNDFRRISTQVKLINDDSIKNINRLKLYRVKL